MASQSVAAGTATLARPGSVPLWLWPNLLSLDAPVIALVWQDFLGRCFPAAAPSPAARFALLLAVWAIYIADRLIDVRHPARRNETPRHRFYRRNQALACCAMAGIVILAISTAALWLPPAVLGRGLALGLLVALYLLVFPATRRSALKHPFAASLFSAGVVLALPVSWPALVIPTLAFAALCLGNMKLVERGTLGQTGRGLLASLAVAAVALGHSPWHGAVAAAAAALAALDYLGSRVSRNARGVLADLVLLTPLLLR